MRHRRGIVIFRRQSGTASTVSPPSRMEEVHT